jgi:hypothetical protein
VDSSISFVSGRSCVLYNELEIRFRREVLIQKGGDTKKSHNVCYDSVPEMRAQAMLRNKAQFKYNILFGT